MRASEADALASLLRDLGPDKASVGKDEAENEDGGGGENEPRMLSPVTSEEGGGGDEGSRAAGGGAGTGAGESVSWGVSFAPAPMRASHQSDVMGRALQAAEKVMGVDPAAAGRGGSEEEVDLLFDPVLNCYYDPATNRYYELQEG